MILIEAGHFFGKDLIKISLHMHVSTTLPVPLNSFLVVAIEEQAANYVLPFYWWVLRIPTRDLSPSFEVVLTCKSY